MDHTERRRFLESVRPLVCWLARRLAPRGIDPDDLAQESLMLTWRDAGQFDPTRGTAAAWVRIIVVRSASALARKRGRVGQLPVNADGAALEVSDPKAPDPSDAVVTHDTAANVRRAVASLPERERRLVGMRYGLGTAIGVTLAEAGSTLGVSAVRAGQVERRALGRLREALNTSRQMEK